ncbi:DUF6960 family protein [Lacrimispora amygdalina]|uniref:DUF6960 family protein n=1 Tax=Lacrimispora amygdalina TaxID=253257 RepID=UPI000BE36A38|nr:hypothetical protein [Lacrimispora amygdalina]
MDYTGTWGVYQCFQGTDDDMIAAEDREEFFALKPNGKVFQCVSMSDGMIKLKYGKKEFRVIPKLYKVVNEPQYKLGDIVEIIEKSSIGQIIDVEWHIKDNTPFYFLKIEGKRSGKRYKDYEVKEVR